MSNGVTSRGFVRVLSSGADPGGAPGGTPFISGRKSKLQQLKGYIGLYKQLKQAKLGPEAKDSSYASQCV